MQKGLSDSWKLCLKLWDCKWLRLRQNLVKSFWGALAEKGIWMSLLDQKKLSSRQYYVSFEFIFVVYNFRIFISVERIDLLNLRRILNFNSQYRKKTSLLNFILELESALYRQPLSYVIKYQSLNAYWLFLSTILVFFKFVYPFKPSDWLTIYVQKHVCSQIFHNSLYIQWYQIKMKARPPVCLNREKTQTMLMDFPYTCIFGIFITVFITDYILIKEQSRKKLSNVFVFQNLNIRVSENNFVHEKETSKSKQYLSYGGFK